MNVVPSLDPASPRVRFGAELRRLREAAQLSQAAVAARLGRTQTQVSRLEKATRTPSKSDAERLDRLFGTPDGVSFTRLYQRIVAQPGAPVWFRSWVEEIEPTARVLRSWNALLVCLAGLLGAFMIAELPDGQPDAVHVDSSAAGQVTTEHDTVSAIWKRYEAIRRWAYPASMSIEMIEEARRGWT
ncbi:hypothetical protein Mame01_49450 [Microbispora amethystogenes]|nr:hypothetical protein Mame01_49450 [Microbispora amethystogenes]